MTSYRASYSCYILDKYMNMRRAVAVGVIVNKRIMKEALPILYCMLRFWAGLVPGFSLGG